ncbi:MAG TPA: hypothetical protein DDW65_15955, partial [Firmicutes bacterium]|nr:hypothetical protein [Bacillota bacterium]
DDLLFEELRKLRREIATREGVPPYIIFADVTLHEMAQYTPTDAGSMLKIKGVGESKLQKYGDLFINVIQKHRTATKLSGNSADMHGIAEMDS